MDEETAKKLLGSAVKSGGGLHSVGWYLAWTPGDEDARLDGTFSADALEAIAWWMRNKGTTR